MITWMHHVYSWSKFWSSEQISESEYLEWGSILSFLGCILLLISFCSPYWLASWEDTMSPFLNLGLWTVCFDRFRHPHVQFDKLYDGCYAMWGEELRMISYWISPGWMIGIQVSSTSALVVTLLSQMVSMVLVTRFPTTIALRLERKLVALAVALNGYAGLTMLVSVSVFCLSCWSRDWLLYPNYNYLSWSTALALCSSLAFLAAALAYSKERRFAAERESKNLSILYKIYPSLNPSLGSIDVSSFSGSYLW